MGRMQAAGTAGNRKIKNPEKISISFRIRQMTVWAIPGHSVVYKVQNNCAISMKQAQAL